MTLACRTAGAVAAALIAVLTTAPALAHGGDPTLVPSLTAVTPRLPAGAVVLVLALGGLALRARSTP